MVRKPLCAFIVLVFSLPFFGQEMSPAQKEVWQMEETYWRDVKAADEAHYLSLWHENFLGWPYYTAAPIGKGELAKNVHRKFTETKTLDYQILSKAVQITGNVGITQLSVRSVYTDHEGKQQVDNLRITHTWLKTESGWKILGGMSLKLEPPKLESSGEPR